MAIKAFLYLPENDNIIFNIVQDETTYKAFIAQLEKFTALACQHNDATLFYDAQNVQTFIAKVEAWNESNYLVNYVQLIRHLGLSREASELKDESEIQADCLYFLWDFEKMNIDNAPKILAEVAERIWKYPTESYILLNFQNTLETPRNALFVFKDAPHIAHLPEKFAHIHFVTDKDELEIWLATNTQSAFSLLDRAKFKKTKLVQQGKAVFEELNTGYFWYLDNFHKNEYEVFDIQGKHLGTANLEGVFDEKGKKDGRTINL